MTLFLRTKDNNTIADIELYKTKDTDEPNFSYVDISCTIDIKNYSNFLLNNLDKKDLIIFTFDNISEIRGWLWEVYFMSKRNTDEEYSNVLKELRKILNSAAENLDLCLVED